MKLSFVRKPAFHGITISKRGVSVQFFEDHEGVDHLKVTSDSPRQVIYVPVSLINKALEDQWARDSSSRTSRLAQAQQFQNTPADG